MLEVVAAVESSGTIPPCDARAGNKVLDVAVCAKRDEGDAVGLNSSEAVSRSIEIGSHVDSRVSGPSVRQRFARRAATSLKDPLRLSCDSTG